MYGTVGVKGSVLQWFASYLKRRTFSVNLGNCSSSSAIVWCAPGIYFGTFIVFPLYAPLGPRFLEVQHFISLLCR